MAGKKSEGASYSPTMDIWGKCNKLRVAKLTFDSFI
jgi:hypothetical protein